MRRQVNGTCVKGMKSASVRMRDKDEERARRGRKFREKRKTCRDIAEGRGETDWNEREASLRFSLWQVNMKTQKGERESNKFLRIFFFFEKISEFLEPNLIVLWFGRNTFFSCISKILENIFKWLDTI